MQRLSVSIVIPAFNEESHLRLCLESIARQTIQPLEVIVVDNNSIDATAAIARSFPFVTLITERRQGVVWARDRGFDAARGDIIGRLDADSVIAPDWVDTVQRLFAVDPSLCAATGSVQYREACLPRVFDAVDFKIRSFMARRTQSFGEQTVQGVNLAVRKSAWTAVRAHVCHERRYHEDLDLSAHMSLLKQKVIFAPSMVASMSARRADSGPLDFYRYAMSNPQTYREHSLKSRRYMYPIVWCLLALYLPMRIAYRGYNPATGRFSLRCLFHPEVTAHRVSPVAATLPE